MRCQKCQFWCDNQDAFCRKCGAPLADEAVFLEQPDTLQPPVVPAENVSAVALEFEAPTQTTSQGLAISPPPTQALGMPPPRIGLKSKMVGLANRALGSEEGRAIAKGAAVLAVSVGVELLNRARQHPTVPRQHALSQPPELPMLADLIEPVGQLAPGITIVETWAYRYSYTRRTVRRVR